MKVLYNPKAFITHAAWLDQGFPHCPIFPTAASRRSLGRVSVPVWLIFLSEQLPIVALVSLYPTNKLIRRRLLLKRLTSLALRHHAVLAVVSHSCPPLLGTFPRVTHPSATTTEVIVRLACVKHAASVRSEPGSNSQVDLLPKATIRSSSKPLSHNVRAYSLEMRQGLSKHRRKRSIAACASLPSSSLIKEQETRRSRFHQSLTLPQEGRAYTAARQRGQSLFSQNTLKA